MQAIVSSLGDSCCSEGDLVAHIGVLIVLAQVALHKPGIVCQYILKALGCSCLNKTESWWLLTS